MSDKNEKDPENQKITASPHVEATPWPKWVGAVAALALVVAVAALVVGAVALAESNDSDSSSRAAVTDSLECGGYGHLHDDKCHCDDGYVQDPQDPMQCIEEECGGHGHLHGDECHCDEGYEENEGTCMKATPAATYPPEECSGHGHTHGEWCHCDDGFIMEPADPMRCSFGMWDPCETAFETGEFDIRLVNDLLDGGSIVTADIRDNVLVMVSSHKDESNRLIDVNGKILHSQPAHPKAMGSFGVTAVRKIRGNHLLGYIFENGSEFEGAYGYRYNIETEEYELFDPYTEMNINTTGWDYLDQAILDENENGDLIGYYYDGDKPGYAPFILKNDTRNYTPLEVPGATGHVFPWTFAGPNVWAGRAKFNSTWNPAHWINVDGTGLQIVAPFGSTLASIDSSIVTDGTFKGVVGHYRDPSTDGLPFSERVLKGFIGDTIGNYHSIEVPDSQTKGTMVRGVTDRCSITGTYTDSEGNSGSFIGIPKEPGRH